VVPPTGSAGGAGVLPRLAPTPSVSVTGLSSLTASKGLAVLAEGPPNTWLAEPRRHILKELSAVAEDEVGPKLGSTCAGLVGLTGAAIVVVTGGAHRAVLWSSDQADGRPLGDVARDVLARRLETR